MPLHDDALNNVNSDHLEKFKQYRYPLLITLGFFLATSYVAFFHHPVWSESDGIYYLNWGKSILEGNGKNVLIVNGQVGGPIIFAYLDSIFHDAFSIEKIIAILSGTGIIFFSYLITKNIFNHRIALVAQLLVAFHPRLHYVSIQALNELLPVFLIFFSLFLITKKHLRTLDFTIIGTLLGISSIIRIQAIFVLIPVIIFILVRNKDLRKNSYLCVLLGMFFLIGFSPQIVYNYYTHETIFDSDPSFYFASISKFQTPEWHTQLTSLEDNNIFSIITADFDLFQKNYFYNLFYHNPDRLFNFGSLDNLSPIPFIPFIGLFLYAAGLLYYISPQLTRTTIITLAISVIISLFLVFSMNIAEFSFLPILIIPLFSLTMINIRKIQTNFLPLIILSTIYIVAISILPIYRSYHLLPMWLPIMIFNAIFLVEVIPKLVSKLHQKIHLNIFQANHNNLIITSVIVIILLLNLGFYYKLIDSSFYGNPPDDPFSIFGTHDLSEQPAMEVIHIANILSAQPNIENSYIMANTASYSYYAKSKFVYSEFREGIKDDTLNDFVSRKNWSDFDLHVSNLISNPPDRNNLNHPIVDYVVYSPYLPDLNTTWHVSEINNTKIYALSNPDDPMIPSNFKLLFKSNQTGITVYKIYHEK